MILVVKEDLVRVFRLFYLYLLVGSWYMGMFFNMIECSYNRNVLVNFYMLLVNLMIKYFNDMIVVKSIEFSVFILFKNFFNYI